MKNLYDEYLQVKTSDNLDNKIDVLNRIIYENPKLIDYIINKVDSCFGVHKVYLVLMNVNGVEMVKLGYTKQDNVANRFGEKRYSGRDSIDIISISRENQLQAKGAIEFEKELKKKFIGFKTTTELTLPGKGEFYDVLYFEDMVKIYDEEYPKFEEIVGLKSPN
jgi:hypothetical protein